MAGSPASTLLGSVDRGTRRHYDAVFRLFIDGDQCYTGRSLRVDGNIAGVNSLTFELLDGLPPQIHRFLLQPMSNTDPPNAPRLPPGWHPSPVVIQEYRENGFTGRGIRGI